MVSERGVASERGEASERGVVPEKGHGFSKGVWLLKRGVASKNGCGF